MASAAATSASAPTRTTPCSPRPLRARLAHGLRHRRRPGPSHLPRPHPRLRDSAEFVARWDAGRRDEVNALLDAAYPGPRARRPQGRLPTLPATAHSLLQGVPSTPPGSLPTSWLSDPALYRYVKAMMDAGRVRFLRGDLLGTVTVRGVADTARRLGVPSASSTSPTPRVVPLRRRLPRLLHRPRRRRGVRRPAHHRALQAPACGRQVELPDPGPRRFPRRPRQARGRRRRRSRLRLDARPRRRHVAARRGAAGVAGDGDARGPLRGSDRLVRLRPRRPHRRARAVPAPCPANTSSTSATPHGGRSSSARRRTSAPSSSNSSASSPPAAPSSSSSAATPPPPPVSKPPTRRSPTCPSSA